MCVSPFRVKRSANSSTKSASTILAAVPLWLPSSWDMPHDSQTPVSLADSTYLCVFMFAPAGAFGLSFAFLTPDPPQSGHVKFPLLILPEPLHVGQSTDRKSTRLNSSHANISYA